MAAGAPSVEMTVFVMGRLYPSGADAQRRNPAGRWCWIRVRGPAQARTTAEETSTARPGLWPNSQQAAAECHGNQPVHRVDSKKLEWPRLRNVLRKQRRDQEPESRHN